MVKGAGALAKVELSLKGAGEIALRRFYGVDERQILGEPAGDSRGERASGAVGVGVVDARMGEPSRLEPIVRFRMPARRLLR